MNVIEERKRQLGILPAARSASEAERIVGLPATAGDEVSAVFVQDFNATLVRPGAKITLRPVQLRALEAIAAADGALLPIGVGHGKTLISLLAGAVLGVDYAVVFVQPKTLDYVKATLAEAKQSFYLPETHVVSWGKLSQPDAQEFLDALAEKASKCKISIFADEAHNLRNPSAARTRRLMNWLWAHPKVPFVAASGTLTTRRLIDFAHLAHRALGKHLSPVPIGPELAVWDAVLAGEPQSAADLASVAPLWTWGGRVDRLLYPMPKEQLATLRSTFSRRLAMTPGVCMTRDPSCTASLYIVQWDLPKTDKVSDLWRRAEEIARTYRDPNGDELADDAEVARAVKRLFFGYYYRWKWDGEADLQWIEARAEWARKVRWLIEHYAKPGFDSRALIERVAEQNPQESWTRPYFAWKAVEKRSNPRTVAVWENTSAIAAIVDKAIQLAPCIVWYDEEAVANELERRGIPVRRAAEAAPSHVDTVALSLRAHGTGLNLQGWSQQVFACVPAGGGVWEQVLGRTHRVGQQADEVWAWVPQWGGMLRQALRSARTDAEWIERTTQNPQKLVAATFV